MKTFSTFRVTASLVMGLLATVLHADGQGFGLSVTSSASSIQVSNLVTFTINVTNLTGSDLLDAQVTNTLPNSVQISTVFPLGAVSITNSTVIFELGFFTNNTVDQMTVTAIPTVAGFITNAVTVASFYSAYTASSSVVVQVTNVPPANTDLGVMIFGPAQTVITNDWMTYEVTATNLGPNTAAGVVLTNTLPPGVLLKSAVPNNYSTSKSNLIFNLGTLASGGYTNLQFTIQPTNVATLLLSASIGSATPDTNTVNNSAATNVPVIAYLPVTLVAVTNSAQNYNPQNGLIEQTITLSNADPSSVPSARVVVTGLTNLLANAVGTNAGSPFVYLCNTLDANQSVTLLLQFYRPTRTTFAFTNSQLHAFGVPQVIFAPPGPAPGSTNLVISRIVRLQNGNELLEWPAITNKTYTVVYSDNVLFSNAMSAPPSVTAYGNRLQWVDYGPPTTMSAPTNTGIRFYRVFQNP